MADDYVDPTTLSDEELDAALNPQPEEVEVPTPETPEVPETPEIPEAPVVPVEEEEIPEAPVEEPQPSRREQLRINQLLKKYGDPEAPSQPSQAPKPSGMNYQEELEADAETTQRLEADRQAAANNAYEQGLRQADSIEFRTRLEIDAPKIEGKYPQLSKDSEEFNPVLADTINQMYLNHVGFDPNTGFVQNKGVRYSDYVESMFELADEMGSKKVEAARTNITKQAAQTGLRPDGSVTKSLNLNKGPQEMSDEELDAYLKQNGLA